MFKDNAKIKQKTYLVKIHDNLIQPIFLPSWPTKSFARKTFTDYQFIDGGHYMQLGGSLAVTSKGL